MITFIVIFASFLFIAAILLYLISLKYNGWLVTFAIFITILFSCIAGLAFYENLGYPKEVHIFSKEWELHHYVADDKNQTFHIMIQEKNKKPRLVSYRISNKENYEKQKQNLGKVSEGAENGEQFSGDFNSETEEFVFHKFNLGETYKK